MTSAIVNVPALSVRAPRAAESFGRWAAAGLRWLSNRPARDPRVDVAKLWALANRYESSQPGLAADLRAAVQRWERESGDH
ncbi:MAG TPA: hypothetical protein VLI72_16620 [Methylibium sp.]|nr:hypothetical protein [Methylibium sp.]